jgi:hypothetical protein
MRPSTRHERLLLALARKLARAGERWSTEVARQQTGLPPVYIQWIMRRLVRRKKIPLSELSSPVARNPAERARSFGIISIRTDEQEARLLREIQRFP